MLNPRERLCAKHIDCIASPGTIDCAIATESALSIVGMSGSHKLPQQLFDAVGFRVHGGGGGFVVGPPDGTALFLITLRSGGAVTPSKTIPVVTLPNPPPTTSTCWRTAILVTSSISPNAGRTRLYLAYRRFRERRPQSRSK